MNMKQEQCAIHIVTRAGYADEVFKVIRAAGARGATILNARGEGSRHEVFMGITVDTAKEIIICVVDRPTGEKVLKAVQDEVGIGTKAHSIAFSVPVLDTVGIDQESL